MFAVNSDDIQFLFDSAGETVLVNDIEKNVIITNPTISEYDQKYIHSIEPIVQGDLVTLINEKYLVITETLNKRTVKYKALMRHCNYTLQFAGETTQVLLGYDDFGAPVYDTVQSEPIYIPAIIDNKYFSVNLNSQMPVPSSQIVAVVQDKDINRKKVLVNDTFTFIEKTYKVLNRDFTKKGLVILTCESTTSTS